MKTSTHAASTTTMCRFMEIPFFMSSRPLTASNRLRQAHGTQYSTTIIPKVHPLDHWPYYCLLTCIPVRAAQLPHLHLRHLPQSPRLVVHGLPRTLLTTSAKLQLSRKACRLPLSAGMLAKPQLNHPCRTQTNRNAKCSSKLSELSTRSWRDGTQNHLSRSCQVRRPSASSNIGM